MSLSDRVNRACVAGVLAGVSVLAGSASVLADDISVFRSGLNSTNLPNVMFVLDYSGSMKDDIHGGDPLVSGLPAKVEILQGAVSSLLANSVGVMNVGIGPLYAWTSGGVKWPISSLDGQANEIDPAIPAGVTNGEVMNSLVQNRYADSGTATVSALTETALYFRGDPVANGGSNSTNPARFTPEIWDVANERYQGGNVIAPNPVTYMPSDAYVFDAGGSTGISYCSDYTPSGGANYCLDLATINCEYQESGDDSEGGAWARNLCSYVHPDQWNGASYNSPIVNECQKNYIILLSDGRPSRAGNFDALEDLLGYPKENCEDLSTAVFNSTRTQGNCGPELAAMLANNNQNPDIANSWVKTSTIGFSVSDTPGAIEYLERVATAGQGSFYEANSSDGLTDVLRQFVDEIRETSESFVELTVDINKANFSHDNKAYFPLFQPSLGQSWAGNLKGYFVDGDGLKDLTNTLATEQTDEGVKFTDTAHSFWSSTSDGNDVESGGASEDLPTAARNLYTYAGDAIPPGGISLPSHWHYALNHENVKITTELLNISADDAYREELLDWMRVQPMGAPLHSKAQIVNYPNGQKVIYVMTNQGFLHAFDASSPVSPSGFDTTGGQELFAFMPKELLENIDNQKNDNITGEYIYGLDGGITRWHDDANNDGIVNESDTVLLIFGMRRGGSSYYAMDITSPDNPVLKWQIDAGDDDFTELGQSWSRASLINVKRGAAEEKVLVFGGGYDNSLDDSNAAAPSIGNSIYMVDRDGDFIWSADHPMMQFAIPSDLTVIDSDNDGLADRIYAGDLGSQVWRIDFDDVNEDDQFNVFRLADLSGLGYQPFFYPPSVALHTRSTDEFISVAIGSGNRDMPMDELSSSAFYMLRDRNVSKGVPGASTLLITQSNLYDTTDNEIESDTESVANAAKDALRVATGWRIDLEQGEKSLSSTVTFEGSLLATTFKPDAAASQDSCSAHPTISRFYMLDIKDGTAVQNLDGSADESPLTTSDRYKQTSSYGIASAPSVLFPEGSGKVQIFVGKEAVSEVSQTLQRTLWTEKY